MWASLGAVTLPAVRPIRFVLVTVCRVGARVRPGTTEAAPLSSHPSPGPWDWPFPGGLFLVPVTPRSRPRGSLSLPPAEAPPRLLL